MDIKGQISIDGVTVGGLNTPLSSLDKSSKLKINKTSVILHHRSNGLKRLYRKFYPTETEHLFFSEVHGTFSRTDHILGYLLGLPKKNEKISGIWYYVIEQN